MPSTLAARLTAAAADRALADAHLTALLSQYKGADIRNARHHGTAPTTLTVALIAARLDRARAARRQPAQRHASTGAATPTLAYRAARAHLGAETARAASRP